MQEENIFMQNENEEMDRPPGNGNNCNGHLKSIQAGGNGHWTGDSCGCDGGAQSPSVSINAYIPLLAIFAIILIVKTYKRL